MPRLRFKVCCILDVSEARLAVAHGADALGLVSRMPSGPGVIDEARIAEIVRVVPPPVATFLLTCEQDVGAIVAQQRRAGASTLQLCDALPPAAHRELRAALPGIRLVQVIHVRGEDALAEAVEAAPWVDALLLDSGNPGLPQKELGGTGRVHDWALSWRIVERVPVPVFLAGGLGPDNVAAAVATVRPFAVDVCSGVRTDGRLDASKLARFAAALR